MAKVLLGWELGEGLGHVQPLLRIARTLAEHGHQPIFALANVVEPWPLFRNDSIPVFQAPLQISRLRGDKFLASSLADVLAVRGWDSVDRLFPLVEAWRHLLESVQPQLIVADYAPTLCLAAYGTMPVVQVGSWFGMPPVDKPMFPLLVPGQTPVMAQDQLLEVVQEVQRRRGRTIPPTLTNVFAAGDRFPFFFTELDPYQADRKEPIWDPLDPISAPAPDHPPRSFFAYLTAENPNVEGYLTHMALTGIPGTAYVRSASAEMKERLRLQGLTILDQPAPIDEMFAKSAVFVHHAGSTANAALAAGRPQLLFPQHLEQATTAQILARMGVGVFVMGNAALDAAARALMHILNDYRFADNARNWSRRIHERPRRPALPAILECCLKHLKSAS